MVRVSVEVRDGDWEKALSIFQSKVKESEILYKYKENQRFTSNTKERQDAEHAAKMREKDRPKYYPGQKLGEQ